MVGLPRLRNPISKLRPPALAPLALAAFPLLTVYAGNLREISPGELLAALGLFLGGTLLLNYLLRRLDSSQERADLTTLWLVATTFSFALGEMLLAALPARWQAFVPPTTLAAAWLLLAPLGAWGLRAGGFDLAKLRRAADLFSASLFVVAVVLLGMAIHLSPWLWSLPTAENPRAALCSHKEKVLTSTTKTTTI